MSQKQPLVVLSSLSSCEAEFMTATEPVKQSIWIKEFMCEILSEEGEKVVLRTVNKSAIAQTKNLVLNGRSKHILSTYHIISFVSVWRMGKSKGSMCRVLSRRPTFLISH